MQSYPSSKSQKNIHPNKINTKEEKKIKDNKKAHNFKPRFQPIQYPPTSPTYTATNTNITTNMQYNPTILKTRATLKTAGTQYTLPTSQNHSATYTNSRHHPRNTTTMPHQPNTHHTLQHTYRSIPSENNHPLKRSSPSSSHLLLLTAHVPCHRPS